MREGRPRGVDVSLSALLTIRDIVLGCPRSVAVASCLSVMRPHRHRGHIWQQVALEVPTRFGFTAQFADEKRTRPCGGFGFLCRFASNPLPLAWELQKPWPLSRINVLNPTAISSRGPTPTERNGRGFFLPLGHESRLEAIPELLKRRI
jgi:hypothetical protein